MSSASDIRNRVNQMTLAQKVGQVFVLTWRNIAQAHADLALHPGGFIRIYSDAYSVARDTEEIQAAAGGDLIIAADLERGIGGTISGAVEVVTAMALGATGSVEAAYDAGRIIGSEAAAMGINMNYAPVLDLNSNPLNPVINTRSFGSSPALVSKMALAFAKGLNSAGVAACGKHFPGHGDTGFDSHTSLGSLTISRQRLDEMELAPFREAIAAGIDSIMSAHLLVPAIEPEPIPATLSKRIMTGLLRDELGFKGVAVSDALEMGAVTGNFPPEIAIPMAINAGCDQLIMPQDPAFAVDVLLSAIRRGEVTEARLNESVERILIMKDKYQVRTDVPSLHKYISVPAHKERASSIAEESLTLVRGDGTVPFKTDQSLFCLTLTNGGDSRSYFLEPQSFADYLAREGANIKTHRTGSEFLTSGMLPEDVIEAARQADVIILTAFVNVMLNSGTIDLPESVLERLEPILSLQKPLVVVSFGSPYIGNQFPQAQTYACAYSATQPSQEAMAKALLGKAKLNGKLPISLN